MNHKLPNAIAYFATVVGICAMFAAAQDPRDQDPTKLLAQAIDRLTTYDSLRAKTRYEGHLFGHEIVGTGSYLQKGRDGQLQWQLDWKLRVGTETTARHEVCNGDSLWVEVSGDTTPTQLSRVNLRKIRPERAKTANGNPRLNSKTGGVPGFLESLDEQYRWISAEPSRLEDDNVWIIDGELKRAFKSVKLPNLVRVVLARDGEFDLFPFRVEWYRNSEKPMKRMLVVDYFAITANPLLPEQTFEFDPGDRDFTDATDVYLSRNQGVFFR
jgi:hypothetical protein